MKYEIQNIRIVQDLREKVNNNILTDIATGAGLVTPEQVFNCYTGKGGLHNLEYSDFHSFHEYTAAKKEIEQGQFYTSAETAQKIVKTVRPEGSVLDPTCGHGVFCNYLNERNFTGVEIDPDSVKVARYLYPDANIEEYDARYWKAKTKFDYILSNPPFNLRWGDVTSQFHILQGSKDWLAPYGLFAAIVPDKYLMDDMYFKRDVGFINGNFNWLGQVRLSAGAFKTYGVAIATKVIFFQNCEGADFKPTYQTWEEITNTISAAKHVRRNNLLKAVKRTDGSNDYSFSNNQREKNGGFEFQLRKYLYETKQQFPKKYDPALALVKKYNDQVRPDGMDYDEWEKVRLTEAKVLAQLRKYAGHKSKRKRKVDSRPADPIQLTPFSEIRPSAEVVSYLDGFTFKDNRGEHHLTEIQKSDVAKILMKRYGILNWEQGCGKTPAAFAVAEYRKQLNVVIAPALAINGTWKPFLQTNKRTFQIVKKLNHVRTDVDYLLFSYSQLACKRTLVRQIKKTLSNVSIHLICDESDEMTNRGSKTYKAVRSAFGSAKYKLLTTGTTTRNNAAEIYPQLELLYNNSLNMVDLCERVTVEDKKEKKLTEKVNDNYGQRFHPYKGMKQFKRCFSPSKTTVFGISKHDQDVYNYSELLRILNYTSLVRTFKEVAGDKYQIKQVKVLPNQSELALQEKILEEFHAIWRNHFNSTGSARKDSGLRIVRQMQLLIKSCSVPETFPEYTGIGSTKKSKIMQMVKGVREKVCVGCTTKAGAYLYFRALEAQEPFRPIFYIDGEVSFNKRKIIIKEFEATKDGVLVCTQQSLKSSVSIPSCNHCIVESLQWNLPKMSQFYFRYIRFNSREKTTVYFVTYDGSIEDNLLALIMTKEKINKAVKFANNEDVFRQNGLDESLIESIMRKRYDEDKKKMVLGWGTQKIT